MSAGPGGGRSPTSGRSGGGRREGGKAWTERGVGRLGMDSGRGRVPWNWDWMGRRGGPGTGVGSRMKEGGLDEKEQGQGSGWRQRLGKEGRSVGRCGR